MSSRSISCAIEYNKECQPKSGMRNLTTSLGSLKDDFNGAYGLLFLWIKEGGEKI